jgi:hypothetical protein
MPFHNSRNFWRNLQSSIAHAGQVKVDLQIVKSANVPDKGELLFAHGAENTHASTFRNWQNAIRLSFKTENACKR